ncbi:MAG: methyltransferase domain-containing protein [Spirulina sp. DLM2.Bin59]|nr:MAG: methyltransferase domain-containing protein [Spirulina sp. DLM2.Bin59]
MNAISDPQFWQSRYESGVPPWDLGQAAPGFQALLQSGTLTPRARVMVLGCGAGHDALAFAQSGFAVTGADFAPGAIAAARNQGQQLKITATWIESNIFDLLPEFAHQFDYVVEHTCFCALDPSWRDRYVALVQGLLKPGGELLAIFFTHDRPGGPPFGSTPAEIRNHFAPHFKILELNPLAESPDHRQGEEHWGRFQVKSPSP